MIPLHQDPFDVAQKPLLYVPLALKRRLLVEVVELNQVFPLEQQCTFSIFYSLMIGPDLVDPIMIFLLWSGLVDPIMILMDGTFSRKTQDPEKFWRWCINVTSNGIPLTCPLHSGHKRSHPFSMLLVAESKQSIPLHSTDLWLSHSIHSGSGISLLLFWRVGWLLDQIGERNRWEIDSTVWSGRMSGCEACWRPSPSQSSQKGESPQSRLHLGSLKTIPFQQKRQL